MADAEKKRGRMRTSSFTRWAFIATVVLFVLVLLLRYFGVTFPWETQRGDFTVTFIDVGQGDATLILTKKAAVVVDVGPVSSADKTAGYIRSKTDRIDCIIVTHPHEDHMGALSTVLSEVKTDLVIMNSDASDASFFERALDVIEEKDIPVNEALAGELYTFGDVTVELLAPYEDFGDKNANSIVVRATVEGVSVMITGDATTETETAILKRCEGDALRSDILKVGHHGSNTSNSEAFLEAVDPEIAVISCGFGNSYGHPHSETLARLDKIGATVYRTDQSGTVEVYLENGALKVKTSE